MSKDEKGSKVSFSGDPADVMDGVRRLAQAAREISSGPNGGQSVPLNDLLANSGLKIIATRTDPPPPARLLDKEQNRPRPLVSEVQIQTPTTLPEIKKHIDETYGGVRWFIGVFDPLEGDDESAKLGGAYIKLKSKPKPVFEDDDDEDFSAHSPMYGLRNGNRGIFGNQANMEIDPRLSYGEDEEEDDRKNESYHETLERRKAELALRREEDEYKEEKRRRQEKADGGGNDKIRSMLSETVNTLLGPKIDDIGNTLERKFADISQAIERKLEGLEKEFNRDLTELKTQVGTSQASVDSRLERAVGDIKTEMKDLTHKAEVKEMQTKNDQDRMAADVRSGLERLKDSINQGVNELRTGLAASQDGKGMAELMVQMQANSSTQMTQLTGNMISAFSQKADGQDGITKTVEAFAMLQSAMNPQEGPKDAVTLVAEAVKDAIPEVSNYMKARIDAGKEVTEEVLGKKIDEAIAGLAPQVGAAMTNVVKQEVRKAVAPLRKALPAPVDPAPAPAQAPAPAAAPAQAPAPAQPAPVQPAPAPAAAPGEEVASKEEFQRKISQRINGLLKTLLEEIDIMPAEAEFVGYGLNYLPKQILRKFAEMEGPQDLVSLINKFADPSIIAEMTKQLMTSKEKQAWVANQFQAMINEFNAIEAELSSPAQAQVAAPATEEEINDVSDMAAVQAAAAAASPAQLPSPEPVQETPAKLETAPAPAPTQEAVTISTLDPVVD